MKPICSAQVSSYLPSKNKRSCGNTGSEIGTIYYDKSTRYGVIENNCGEIESNDKLSAWRNPATLAMLNPSMRSEFFITTRSVISKHT